MVTMEESILKTIKAMLGVPEDLSEFDLDITIAINSEFSILNQLGVGVNNFRITGPDEKWSDFLDEDYYSMVKSAVYMRSRLMFDPPQISFNLESLNKLVDELEWRLNINYESKEILDV